MNYRISYQQAGRCDEVKDEFINPPNNKLGVAFWKFNTLHESIPHVDGLILSSDSELTDIIYSHFFRHTGYFLSNKAMKVISEYKLMKHRVIPLKIFYKDGVLSEYNWINFFDNDLIINDPYYYIDFNESYFKHLESYNDRYPIHNEEEYLKQFNSIQTYRAESYKNKWDIYYYKDYLFDLTNLYCSEQLKNRIEEENLTGFSFTNFGNCFESDMKMPTKLISQLKEGVKARREAKRKEYQDGRGAFFSFQSLSELRADTKFIDEFNNEIEQPKDQAIFERDFISKGVKNNNYIRIPENFEYDKSQYSNKKEAFVSWYFEKQNPNDPDYTEFFRY